MRREAPALVLVLASLAACDASPPTWDRVLSQRIAQERPDCEVSAPATGQLTLRCGTAPAHSIDVASIAQFCQRGPRDCEYAIDQALLQLPAPEARR